MIKSAAKFDFVECGSKSYEYVWDHRHSLVRKIAPLLLVKFLAFALILTLELEQNLLRQGLILIPAHFLEGWLIAHIMISAFRIEEDKAYQLPERQFENTKAAVMASTLVYVLIKIALTVALGGPKAMISEEAVETAANTPPAAAGIDMFFMLTVMLVFTFWAFRFLWVYIPLALGFTVGEFLYKIRGLFSSVYLMGAWMMCFVPIGLLMLISMGVVSGIFPDADGGVSMAGKFVLTFIQVFFDTVMVLVSSLGVAYGIASIFNKEDKNVSLL